MNDDSFHSRGCWSRALYTERCETRGSFTLERERLKPI